MLNRLCVSVAVMLLFVSDVVVCIFSGKWTET